MIAWHTSHEGCSFRSRALGGGHTGPSPAGRRGRGPVRIRNIEIFPIEIPIPREELELGKYARCTFYEVETDAGVRGYCFDRGTDYHLLERVIRPALVWQDLFAVDRHLKAGLGRWGGVEEALWDAIGKIRGPARLSPPGRRPVAAEGLPDLRVER